MLFSVSEIATAYKENQNFVSPIHVLLEFHLLPVWQYKLVSEVPPDVCFIWPIIRPLPLGQVFLEVLLGHRSPKKNS